MTKETDKPMSDNRARVDIPPDLRDEMKAFAKDNGFTFTGFLSRVVRLGFAAAKKDKGLKLGDNNG